MRKSIRTALVAGVGALALTFAGSAFASFSPKLVVSTASGASSGGGGVTINATVGASDDPTARVVIYVPNGFQLNSPAVGTRLGGVTASAQAADLGGAVLPLTGDLVVASPATYATQQAQCGLASVAATWDLHLTAAGQTLDVPVFVVQTSGTETALGQFKLQICLPPPDVPAGTPGRATFGAKVLSAVFTSNAFTNPVSTGEYRWRSLWTPYTPRTGTSNPAGSVEAQSFVRIPTALDLTVKKTVRTQTVKVKGKRVKRKLTFVSVSAKVSENNAAISGAKITIFANGKSIKSGTSSAAGTVAITGRVVGKVTFTAKATVADRDLGAAGCTQPAFGVPCVDATVGGQALTQRAAVTVRAAK